ncbi:hypothetical protein STRCI_001286 [Streptomyces cinnabarinus]|uniref:Uncharacterized protein n=1 Tax=Streptomyces cinnabarinus TaxID=67287 RepID=A0ABY7KA42_9ACTN|nr:hypothetical protein [Streptomyces cinnabarinus]WAZ20187.1 hypothetical protein STRCI_001286 [Streptomyces cinnabarinus]
MVSADSGSSNEKKAVSTEEHNTGEPEDKRAALNTIGTLTNSLITLATGTLALTVALLKSIYGEGDWEWAMWTGWGLLAGSVLLGFVVLGQQISLLAESDLKPRGGLLEWLGLIHLLTVTAGLVLLAIFAQQNVGVGTKDSSPPATSPTASAEQ